MRKLLTLALLALTLAGAAATTTFAPQPAFASDDSNGGGR
jgi:hypothetical protein